MSGQVVHNPLLRKAIREQCCTNCSFLAAAPDNDWWLESFTPTASATSSITTQTSFTHDYAPGWPVHVTGLATDDAGSSSDWTAVVLELIGYDQFGVLRAESITGEDVLDGTWTLTGVVAWAQLTSATLTITGTIDSGDTCIYGFDDVWGLGCAIAATADVLIHNFNLTEDAGTVNTVNNTYKVAGTTDAAKLLELYVRSSTP